ncbi:uncharacterized protein FPRO_13284 [Fusarium proliferatum ET1]|uniref:Uncharacterized protein n=1 Tax=Fusarium proliferatum (strain ET1) TaxID=1227346 RepID=A0A1L7W4R4_FUSPR|nr:uncharacterized protein FPRO_13284 [Fusarium proliferatum ET1]CZR47617.1 uncharacterized protein FPRO_13284 [Fusarium proliferatum ET1]
MELWLVCLTIMFALVSWAMRTRVDYDEEQCSLSLAVQNRALNSKSSSIVSVPVGIFTSLGNPKDGTGPDMTSQAKSMEPRSGQ